MTPRECAPAARDHQEAARVPHYQRMAFVEMDMATRATRAGALTIEPRALEDAARRGWRLPR